jgi:hypothetical protein
MEKLNLKLDVLEVNTILSALSRLPFMEVADLISNVRDQGAEQLKSLSAEGTIASPTNNNGVATADE